MKEFGQKVVSALIIIAFGYVVYVELVAPQAMRAVGGGNSAAFTMERAEKIHADLGGAPGEAPIVVFVTSWCGVCRMLEAQLKRAGIGYVRADIENDRKAQLYYEGLTQGKGSGVPLTMVGTQVFMGYSGSILQAIDSLKSSYLHAS